MDQHDEFEENRPIPSAKVKLIKNTKGYNWEVSYTHSDPEVCVKMVDRLNAYMQRKYGTAASTPAA